MKPAEWRWRRQCDEAHALWLLDEADRLDCRAAELAGQPKPDPVADIADMDLGWIEATLGPEHLRRTATDLRARAALLARTERTMHRD